MKHLACVVTIVASPALADCPTGADLANGITFVTDRDETDTFTELGRGVVQIENHLDDGIVFRTLLAQGVHVLQLSDVENGRVVPDSILNTAYPLPAVELPVPEPLSQWSVDTTINAYGDIYRETQTQVWGQTMTYVVGECAFTGIPGKIKYESDGLTIDEEVMFLPDLGLSLLLSYDDNEFPQETYSYVSVRAEE